MTTTRALGALLLSFTVAAGLAGCSDDLGSTAAPAPATTTEPSDADPPVLDDDFAVPLAFDAPPPTRYRLATRVRDARHWLPHDVVADDTEERWADIALYTVQVVYDGATGEPLTGQEARSALRDLPTWFRSHPALTVRAERRVEVAGRRGVQVDVRGTGAPVVGSAEFDGLELGEAERFTFWQVDGHWLCLQASTLRGPGALRAQEKGDVYDRVLRTMRTV